MATIDGTQNGITMNDPEAGLGNQAALEDLLTNSTEPGDTIDFPMGPGDRVWAGSDEDGGDS